FPHRSTPPSTPFKIVDKDGRVIGLLAGRPADASWDDVASSAYSAMAEAAEACQFKPKHSDHRRGQFATLATGVSFGGGRTVPGHVDNSKWNQKILSDLCAVPAIRRLAGFGSAMLSTYAPRIFERTQCRLRALREHHPSLRFNFDNSMYPATTFNFGPATVCVDHTDAANDACNWCHVVALGHFDCDRSGQIVFPDLKLVVRFPHGASILIPLAIVRHGNTPIGPQETRMSMTQYCAGSLLRWVERGFRTVKTL
ncbi:uncharacterized protein TRAVEDRAFT_86929, partial [Trametes versicolor FP-101664 SS1]|uniref:uncharacterized protein n=1 Tax=Trametes versicolor (strain FP-101664) TaxID=717944 RepID=UPI0004624171